MTHTTDKDYAGAALRHPGDPAAAARDHAGAGARAAVRGSASDGWGGDMVKRLRRPARPSFVGLPCQIRPAAIEVLRLMLKRCKLAPIEVAMRNAAVTPSKARNQLTLAELSSLDAITHGHGRLIDFRRLVDANNLTEVLAKDFKIGGDEVRAATEAAEAALLGCARRIEATGKIGFSGPELAAMREMLEWNQAQRETASRGVYLAAIKLLMARVGNGAVTVEIV